MTQYDVVTLGETMLRLTAPGYKRLEQVISLEAEVGGSESNTAVALARLGLRVAWLSRLPSNSLGRLVARTLTGYGVDLAHVRWAEGERLGLYFVEQAPAPREGQVIYDRADSAFSRIRPDQLPTDLFQTDGARLLHITGITPALSQSAAETALSALHRAQEAGWLVSFDLNYRARLWSPEAALAGCEPFAAAADIFILPMRDALKIYGFEADITSEEALQRLTGRYSQATIILTLGSEGALGCEPSGEIIHQPAILTGDLGRIGGGDAFTAGVLYGRLLQNESDRGWLPSALGWGVACAALKYTIPGDIPAIDKAEVERLLQAPGGTASLNR